MKAIKTFLVLLFLIWAAQVYADVIRVNLTAGQVSFRPTKTTGQEVTFGGLLISTPDSANRTALALGAGTSNFIFTSVSGGQGLFSIPSGASFTAGSTTSGLLRGSIASIVLTGATRGTRTTTFTMQVTFSNMSFQDCSTPGCVNSATLQTFSYGSTGTLAVSFPMNNKEATSLSELLAMKGPHANNPLTGAMETTVTPEPASLALFGTGLLVIGMRLMRHRKRPE